MKSYFRSRASIARKLISTLILILLFLHSGWTGEAPSRSQSNAEELLRHVRYLASDELLGRGVDTAGIDMARDYITREFQKSGLSPGGENGTYDQALDVDIGVRVKEASALRVAHGPPLPLMEEWVPLGFSRSGTIDEDIVFVGYGITAKDYDYDDYSGMDVKGKIVLVLRYEPPPKNEKSPFQKFPRYSRYAALLYKANNARDHGANGMILVDLNPRREGEPELIPLTRSLWLMDPTLIAAQARRQVVEKLLEEKGVSLRELKEKIDRDEKPASTSLPGLKASLNINLEKITKKTANVVGALPGSDPRLKKEYVVIGAHYDHLGFGHFGTDDTSTEGQIHHGADDNASGTAVLLNLAERLSRLPERLPRTIVFIAFTGEERGLYGSRYYVSHPIFPIESTRTMINLDMIGRMRNNRLPISGIDTAKEFSTWITEISQKLGIEVSQSKSTGADRSDHASFYNKNIPNLNFSTGLHDDYHRPTDTWDKLNIEGMEKIGDIALALVQKIAETKESLAFVRLPSPSPPPSPEVGKGYGAYLGIIPDFAEIEHGVRLAGVRQGSPAEAAGLKEGDIIVRLADTKVENIEDLTFALHSKNPGEKVKIFALRQGKLLTLQAVLRGRS